MEEAAKCPAAVAAATVTAAAVTDAAVVAGSHNRSGRLLCGYKARQGQAGARPAADALRSRTNLPRTPPC